MSGPSRHRFVWLRNARARWWPGVTTFPCNANRIAGFLPVILVLSIIILAYITAVPATLLPLYTANPFLGVFLLVIFHFIYFNVLANYILLLFADPGGVPDDWRAPLPEYMQEQPTNAQASSIPRSDSATDLAHESEALSSPPFPYFHLMRERTFSGHYRYCRYCNCYKPDRSHHCSACKRCILRMDHHCIFVNNCVSFLNQKFFLGFIAYGFLGCLFVSAVCFRTAASVMLDLPTSNVTSTSKHALAASFSPTLITAVIIGYISCSAFAVALAIFVAFHAFLTLRGRTTIEMYELTDRIRATRVKEYDLGPAKNIRAICGNVPFCWLLPTRAHIDGDGLTFERLVQNSEDPV